MNKTLLQILGKKEWKLGFAAWIFAGYSPLKKQETGLIVRLADEEEFPFGCIEYREAEKAKNEIKNQLALRVMASRGLTSIHAKERFSRNWLISIATIATNEDIVDGNIDVWWKNWACKEHYLPAYVVPDALSDEERKKRGSYSWRIPSRPTEIFDPREYSLGGFGVGTYDEYAKVESDRAEVTPLFEAGAIGPTKEPDDSKYELYPFFYEVIAKQISIVPEKQAEIEGVEKHGMPLPTAAKARDLIIELLSADPKFKVSKGYEGKLLWTIDSVEYELSLGSLNSRILDWFKKTDAGLAYDEFFGITKEKFFKPNQD
jgi:hypothetical protein